MLNSITTVIIDTETYGLGLRALQHSFTKFPTGRVLVYSDCPDKWPGFPVKQIPKLASIRDYDSVLMNDLAHDLETDFALVVQYDGFVINPNQFSQHFLYYDYVGAPWPNFNQFEVGNGGFSLRSKRLIEASATYFEQKGDDAEDTFICRVLRSRLELKHDCKFAPVGLAQHFSTEFHFHAWPTFGFHGFVMLPFVYQKEIALLLENLPSRAFSGDKLSQMSNYFSRAGSEERELFGTYVSKYNQKS